MSRASAATLGMLVALSVAGGARAQPSLWDVARDPSTARAYDALLRAEDHVRQAVETDGYGARWRRHLRAALTELADESDGPDPRLRFLLADVLTDLGGDWHREIVDLLQGALAEAPDSAQAATGWYQLALAAAHLPDRELELRAFARALELTWNPNSRANILYNLGDAKMSGGQLREAIGDFQEALRTGRDPHTQALALYGLGISLERSGDLPSALGAFERGLSLRASSSMPSVLDAPGVFFVPEYDVYYYKALEAMATANGERDAEVRLVDLESAAVFWRRYLFEAEPDRHRWVPNARRNLAKCERDAERLERDRAGQATAP